MAGTSVMERPVRAVGARPSAADAATLFEEHEPTIRRYVAFRVADRRDVDDLVGEVFRRLVTGPAPVDAGARRAWLLRVAHNVVVDHYRRRRRLDPLALVLDRPDDAPAPLERIVLDEQLREVDRALAGLPGRQRAAIYLRFHEGLEYVEIGRILGAPVVTVRTLVHRGLRRVAAEMGEEASR